MSKLELIRLNEVAPQEVDWLWYPYITFGKVTILQGDPGEGKTMLMLNMIADLTQGRNTSWSLRGIQKMIRNETYCGDLLLQKTYRENYLTKKDIVNHGEQPFYKVKDAHDPIIDRETFEKIQAEIIRRSANKNGNPVKLYPFSRLIVCGYCGKHFKRIKNSPGNVYHFWHHSIVFGAESANKSGFFICKSALEYTKKGRNYLLFREVSSGLKTYRCFSLIWYE